MIKVASEAAQILIAKAFEAGQGHILAHWDALDAAGQGRLLATIKEIDFQELLHLIARCVKGSSGRKMGITKPQPIEPAALPHDAKERDALCRIGEETLSRGEVAAFMAAGVCGEHLGLAGPEGMCPVGAISQKTLFQLHAEQVAALNRRYRIEMPFFVMTSAETDEETQEFFKANYYFTLPPRSVVFLRQPRLPIVDRRGKILMTGEADIAMAPNGHGGAFLLMTEQGFLERLRRQGVRHVFYFQVNNPFVRIAAEEFVGRHARDGAEVSARCVRKERPDERVGVFVRRGAQMGVIEYSDLSDAMRKARDPATNELAFGMGNIAVHIFAREFLERAGREEIAPPYHLAKERVACLDRKGGRVQPAAPNCVRFECDIFDVFPMARTTLLVAADRADEFYPVHAARGRGSPEDVQRAMSERYAGWLAAAGVTLPRDEAGAVRGTYEISPLFARDAEELKEKLDASTFVAGDSLYLE
jgi:UDP-N-acetylglucosamine/UDP-N-acetylgalactosamine diphosphorylase